MRPRGWATISVLAGLGLLVVYLAGLRSPSTVAPKESSPQMSAPKAVTVAAPGPVNSPLMPESPQITEQPKSYDEKYREFVRRDREETNIPLLVNLKYGKVVKGLGASPAEEKRIIALLIARSESVFDVREILNRKELQNRDLLDRAVAMAKDQVDTQIRESFDPVLSRKIVRVIDERGQLQTINDWFDPSMADMGVPLEPKQMLPLMDVLQNTFGSNPRMPELPGGNAISDIDPAAKLSRLDYEAIARAKELLSPQQLAAFESGLVKRNLVIVNNHQKTVKQ